MNQLTVVIGFLEIHVNNTTGPHFSHGVPIQRLDFGKCARSDLIAAIFSEENRNGVVAEFLGASFVFGIRVSGVTTPRVDVVSPEVDRLIGFLAIEVVGHVLADIRHISGSISYTHGAIALLFDVLLHVTNSSLDKGTSIRGGNGIGNLIPCKETNRVVVLGELVNDTSVSSVETSLPRWITSVNGLRGVGQIGDKVDASFSQELHARRVVGRGVNGVSADDIGAQLLHDRDITGTCGSISQRVGVVITVSGFYMVSVESSERVSDDLRW